MRYTKTQEAHIERRQVPSRTTCDSCGRNTDHADRMYHEEEATISASIGDVYPDSDRREAYDVDVCGECFTSKVVPALEAIGIKVRTRHADSPDSVPEGGAS